MPSTPPNLGNLFFLDIETTGLSTWKNKIWEIACIAPDGRVFREAWVPDLSGAHPQALLITRFVDRYSRGELWKDESIPSRDKENQICEAFKELVEEFEKPRILAGASVHFDKSFLEEADYTFERLFSHRILDVPTFASPLVGDFATGGLDRAGKKLGIEKDPDLAHDALYDAWYTRCVYQAALELAAHMRQEEVEWPESWVFYENYEDVLAQNKRLFID